MREMFVFVYLLVLLVLSTSGFFLGGVFFERAANSVDHHRTLGGEDAVSAAWSLVIGIAAQTALVASLFMMEL